MAWSVNTLVASPLAKGLFHRAISESGTCTLVNVPLKDPSTPTVEDSMEERGTRFATSVGCTDLACPGQLVSERIAIISP